MIMPAPVGGNTVPTESPVLGLLRSHKVLPRESRVPKRITSQDVRGDQTVSTRQRDIGHDHSITSRATALRSTTHCVKAVPMIGQPPTPPMPFRDNFKSWLNDKALRDGIVRSQNGKVDPSFLINRSPPTPETTPPSHTHSEPMSRYHLNDGGIIPDNRDRLSVAPAESRSDSFTTARENISSDDETPASESPSLHPARRKWLKDTGLPIQGGVGLGFEIEPLHQEPPAATHPLIKQRRNEFVAFDGAWGSHVSNTGEDTESETTARRNSDEDVIPANESPSQEPRRDSTSRRFERKTLDTRAANFRYPIHPSQESTADVQTKQANDQPLSAPEDRMYDPPLDDFEVNAKRVSQTSVTSTIVEAVVIESPPRRRQTLRHTGKMYDVSQGQNQWSRNMVPCGNHTQRPGSHDMRGLNAMSRKRSGSDTLPVAYPKNPIPMEDSISSRGYPDRQSSVQISVRNTKRLSRTFSARSPPLSSRPTTAPDDGIGSFHIPHQDCRAISMIIGNGGPAQDYRHTDKMISSPALARLSPLAVAGSNEISAANSIASGGLKSMYISHSPNSQCSSSPLILESQEGQAITADRSNSGDWPATRPRSNMVTPFSLRSAQSSTPGTLEVNEATAVCIYPHTNKSILVIPEMASRDGSSSVEQDPTDAHKKAADSAASTQLRIRPPTPPDPALMGQTVDSPLQNPRDPPQPPDLKIIPPTPANFSSSSDTVWNSKRLRRQHRFSAPLTSLRRAMSARRYSESGIMPFNRSRSLRSSAGRRRISAFEDLDSRLHPFWRPRTFWGEESDSDSEFGNEGILSPQRRPSSRSTAMNSVHLQRTMSLTRRFTGSLRSSSFRSTRPANDGLYQEDANHPTDRGLYQRDRTLKRRRSFSLSRRVGGSFHLPLSHRPRRASTANWHNQPHYEFIQAEDRLNGSTSRHGLDTPLPSLRSLAERFERRRETKEEGRREQRRNWLKGRIGLVGPKEVKGFDMVHPLPVSAHAEA